ncbi:unnamed protein product [Rhizoctonia solani]|uniref:HNH nuclease domain-containing protein n=1 Tax=Rhizoctonia solani TaxID=456999 RepID=A0A8H3GNQ6_9AGAM|nr:unnamed protein product [Rhizoctonia solani]
MDPNDMQATPGLTEDPEHARNTDNTDRDPWYQPPAPGSNNNLSSRSNFSLTFIPPQAKLDLTAASPAGELCVISWRRSHVECSHILHRASKSSELKKLEFCWGCKPGHLDLDSANNMIWLSPELHKCFDDNHWALVPSLELLNSIRDATFNDAGRRTLPYFLTRYRAEPREYSFVQFQAVPVYHSPADSLPYSPFVICNVAKKDIRHRPEPQSPEALIDGYETLAGQMGLLERVRMCRKIYQTWMSRELPFSSNYLDPTNTLPTQTSQSNPSSDRGSRRSSRPTRDQSGSKESDSKAIDRDNGPRKWRKAQDSTVADSAPTLEEPWSVDDELDVPGGQRGDVTMPFWSKVGSWLRDVEGSVPATDPTFTGAAAEPMEGVSI